MSVRARKLNDLNHSKCPNRPSQASRYNVSKLVWYEAGYDPAGAIAREKQTKAGSRQKKIDLINQINPEWRDLYDNL